MKEDTIAPHLLTRIIIKEILGKYLFTFEPANILYRVAVMKNPERIPHLSVWGNAYLDKKNFNKEPDELWLTIIVTHSKQTDRYAENSINDMLSHINTLQESFVYNHVTDIWTKYSRDNNGNIKKEIGNENSIVLNSCMRELTTPIDLQNKNQKPQKITFSLNKKG